MSQITQALERDALAAFKHGDKWETFWRHHGAAVRMVEPFDRRRFKRLYDRLLSLVTSGDCNGMEPIDDGLMPWDRDDAQAKPADVGTQARCDWATLNEGTKARLRVTAIPPNNEQTT